DGAGTTAIKNYQLEKLHLGGKVVSGKLELENTDIDLHSGATFHSDYASIDFSEKIPSYDFDMTTKDLSITDFAPMFPLSSRVSVEANLSGSGLSANNLTGSVNAEISGLEQNKKPLPNITLSVTLERDESGRRVDIITSSIADLSFKGKYNIETIGTLLADRVRKISATIRDRGKYDAFAGESINRFCPDSIDLSYTANIKDLRPIAPFIPTIIFLGSGKLSGSVVGCDSGQIAVSTTGNIHNFFMRQRHPSPDSSGIPLLRLRDTKFSFAASGIGNDEKFLLHSLKSEFTIQSDSILKFSGAVMEKPRASIELSGGDLRYSGDALFAKSLGIHLSGTGNLSMPDLTFQPDSLSLAFSKLFVWHSDRSSPIIIGADGSIELDTLSLMRPKPGDDSKNRFAERIKLGVKIKGDSIAFAYITTPEFDLVDVPKFFSAWTFAPELSVMRGRVSKLEAFMHGSLSRPNISAELALKNFVYHDVTIDSGRMNLFYHNLTLSGKARFHVDTAAFAIDNMLQNRENFPVSGNNSFRLDIDSVPFLFALEKYPEYKTDSAEVGKRTMSIRASGKDYPLDMFSPFIPVIADLHGLADIELSVNGTRENSVYKGSVDTRRGSFVLPMTNMQYTFNGKLLLSNDEMKFVDIKLANIPGDDIDGRAVLNGSLYFKGFNVERFGLTLSAPNRISVLSEASKQTLKSIYGPLAIRTDGGPLTFSGDFNTPMLSGNIIVVQGFLTLPQSDVSSTNLLNDGITYRIKKEDVIDTVRRVTLTDSLKNLIRGIASSDTSMHYNDTAFEEATRNLSQTPASQQFTAAQLSFQDKMLYDLQITVPGNLWITINLSKAYGLFPQILTAEIKTNGALTYSRSVAGEEPIKDGTIQLTDKSTFKFIKDFSPVSGTIFLAKNLDNSTLNIAAEYTGTHRSNAGTDETIKIKLIIEGTLSDQQLTMELYRKNIQGDYAQDSRSPDIVKADVLTYLINGSFASDNTQGQGSTFGNTGTNAAIQAGSTLANSLLSSTPIKDYVRSVGFEVDAQSRKIAKASFGVKDYVSINAGYTSGTNGYSSTDLSFEVPFSSFLNFGLAKQIVFSGEAHVANSSDPG
ncbi:MAG: hypothetical protein ACHQM6_06220, partial [Candidatus Kapaibacterium sp.]